MQSTLNINTLYNNPNERNIAYLSTVYNDRGKLITAIKKSIGNNLNKGNIEGKSILLKPNWVRHSKNINDELCLRTHDNFILAALTVFLEMGPSKLIIGDAPIQGCHWDKMISKRFVDEIDELAKKYNIPVRIEDFRRRTYFIDKNKTYSDIKPISEYHIYDLGKESALEPITTPGESKFRVTNYNPDRMSSAHSPGIHKYCIAREFTDADIIISLPKIKTHQKSGITGALKNIVGINGDKDFLPHHRIGGTGNGGDCYPGNSLYRYWAELSLDNANRRQGKRSFWVWQKVASLLWKLSLPGPEHQLAAGWYGNDTTWRMVKDLNKIAEYGNKEGTLSKHPQRTIFSLCDGIIGGQGDGPLEPEPLPLGLISFTNNSLLNDYVMGLIMDLPIDRIPLLKTDMHNVLNESNIKLKGRTVTLDAIKQYSITAKLPKGWARLQRFQDEDRNTN